MSESYTNQIQKMLGEGKTAAEISKKLGCSKSLVYQQKKKSKSSSGGARLFSSEESWSPKNKKARRKKAASTSKAAASAGKQTDFPYGAAAPKQDNGAVYVTPSLLNASKQLAEEAGGIEQARAILRLLEIMSK
jgi:hypothetical protein